MKEIYCHACGETKIEVDDDYEEEYCCPGTMYYECGCMGAPINPIFCKECDGRLCNREIGDGPR